MLKINLIPEYARKTTLSSIEQFHRIPLLWVVVVFLVGFVLLLFIPVYSSQQHLQVLNKKIQALQPKQTEVQRLQQALQELRVQAAAFEGLQGKRHVWSKRLNILSDVTPEGVWFTNLNLDPLKGLVIQGSAIGRGGGEMVSVGRLVQDLKADTEFAATFKDIQIESLKRVYDKEIEIVRFTLICTLGSIPENPPTQLPHTP